MSQLTLIVNIFKFFDRKDLEIITETGNFVNRIVRKHFPSKPYRFLNDLELSIYRREDGLSGMLSKESADVESSEGLDEENHSSGSQDSEDESSENQDAEIQSSGNQDAENQSSGSLCLNPYKNEWVDPICYFPLDAMRPYLSQFVRVARAELFCYDYSYTPEDMTILASISHVWSDRSLHLLIDWQIIDGRLEPEPMLSSRNDISNSIHNILSDEVIFSVRRFDLHNTGQFVCLHDYSRVYSVDMLLIPHYTDHPLNIGPLLALIEHKSQFPKSKTLFLLENWASNFEVCEAEVTDAIRRRFSSASKTCPFQLVIMDSEKSGVNSGESEEFREENENTREVLQLKNIKQDSSFVTKIWEACARPEVYRPKKYILIERSQSTIGPCGPLPAVMARAPIQLGPSSVMTAVNSNTVDLNATIDLTKNDSDDETSPSSSKKKRKSK